VVIARADHAWQAAAFSVEITAAPCGAALAEVHAWVERDCDGCGSHLAPSHRASTLTSLACAPGIAGLDTADQASRRR
jgi:hypothetical protein